MRANLAILFMGLVLITTSTLAGDRSPIHEDEKINATERLPLSLNAWYPPAANGPVYLTTMVGLGTLFSGIVVDLMENDLQGARQTFTDFKAQYLEVASMVPEWREAYPLAPVEALGASLNAGGPAGVMAAFEEVGQLCHRCHVKTMVPVQQQYHWGDFSAISITDPLSQEALAFTRFKQVLSASLAGITIDLRQEQTENARRQFQAFKARFQTMAESCAGCHGGERTTRFNEEVQSQLTSLEQTLASPTVDHEAVGSMIQTIGRESCYKCHLVHVPAAMYAVAAR